MRGPPQQRTVDQVATIAVPILALVAAVVTAMLSGCGEHAWAGQPERSAFLAGSISFVPDEGAGLRLAGVDLEQGRFALRVGGGDLAAAAATCRAADPEAARLERVTSSSRGGKLHFTALRPGSTRIECGGAAGGTLVVE